MRQVEFILYTGRLKATDFPDQTVVNDLNKIVQTLRSLKPLVANDVVTEVQVVAAFKTASIVTIYFTFLTFLDIVCHYTAGGSDGCQFGESRNLLWFGLEFKAAHFSRSQRS